MCMSENEALRYEESLRKPVVEETTKPAAEETVEDKELVAA